MSIAFPEGFFGPPVQRDETWPDFPELRCAIDWLTGFMAKGEWATRRATAATRFYDASGGRTKGSDKGPMFVEVDTLGWYLFLGEAFIDHIWNYEPAFGSRVVPVLAAIGRNLDLLRSVDGLEDRARRLVNSEHRQPNGGLFELLVAAAYRRAGGVVTFLPEKRGIAKTHDMDVAIGGRTFAVECKRMETSAYGAREREQMRELWRPSSSRLADTERSTFCDAHFDVPIELVQPDYLATHTRAWLASGKTTFSWSDAVGHGVIGDLDLGPLKEVLSTDHVLAASSRLHELLTGHYQRHASYIQLLRMKRAENVRYIEDCDFAVLLRWESASTVAIQAKARDILRKLSEANDQLPSDRPGIVHIGFEAVDGDAVEQRRYEKILSNAAGFDPGAKPLEFVYCHYLVPESPPDQAWAFDETTQWCGIRPTGPKPLDDTFLVLPEGAAERLGAHWQS